MTSANSLILGLGLFFLGLRLIGENLRRLYGSSFRNVIKRTTHSPLFGAGLGTLAGAVMQSATAVTFILVSLTDSGLIKARAAAPIIVWCNVGLTALAFVTTLNIHPIVAYVWEARESRWELSGFRSGKRLRARFSAWASFFSVWRKWAPAPLR